MPHRTLLSPEQRTRVLGIPTEAAEMAKHYVLSTEDLALVRTKRRLSNRLGFAVQLCALRHPGRSLSGAGATTDSRGRGFPGLRSRQIESDAPRRIAVTPLYC
jgi:Domain of unknown function (DUF4158)